ncbi:MAG: hypothetical protein Q6373_025040 [Candidatus Sigynarchaeota archaeon]
MDKNYKEIDDENRDLILKGEPPRIGRSTILRYRMMLRDAGLWYPYLAAMDAGDHESCTRMIAAILGVKMPGNTEIDDPAGKYREINDFTAHLARIYKKTMIAQGQPKELVETFVNSDDFKELARIEQEKEDMKIFEEEANDPHCQQYLANMPRASEPSRRASEDQLLAWIRFYITHRGVEESGIPEFKARAVADRVQFEDFVDPYLSQQDALYILEDQPTDPEDIEIMAIARGQKEWDKNAIKSPDAWARANLLEKMLRAGIPFGYAKVLSRISRTSLEYDTSTLAIIQAFIRDRSGMYPDQPLVGARIDDREDTCPLCGGNVVNDTCSNCGVHVCPLCGTPNPKKKCKKCGWKW